MVGTRLSQLLKCNHNLVITGFSYKQSATIGLKKTAPSNSVMTVQRNQPGRSVIYIF